MTTSAARPSDQVTSHSELYFDPDETALPQGSPLMNPVKPNFAITPSAHLSTRRHVDHSRGDAALIRFLDNCRDSKVAREIMSRGRQIGPCDSISAGDDHSPSCSPTRSPIPPSSEPAMLPTSHKGASGPISLDLKVLAAGALAFSSHGTAQIPPIPPHSSARVGTNVEVAVALAAHNAASSATSAPGNESRPSSDDPPAASLVAPSVANPSGIDRRGGRQSVTLVRPTESASPTSPQRPGSGGLPPLQIDSPRSDSSIHGLALPSIRQHFSDLQLSPDSELPGLRHSASFSRSPPSSLPGISSMATFAGRHATSPTSPGSGYRRDLPSPQALAGAGYGFHPFNGRHARLTGGDHSSSTADTPSSDQSSIAPGPTSTERLDGLTIATQQGGYVCTFSGCTAAPFQTQYLLNSHANVHSSARPHYCPVPGCPRSEGGKGFKRKNEMIRHGLVHESPGYVCPFCPDREHKYPRPDNLQRHVRVHHMDKDKDDPLLRDVLSQRPDGPNRGRRRRGAAS